VWHELAESPWFSRAWRYSPAEEREVIWGMRVEEVARPRFVVRCESGIRAVIDGVAATFISVVVFSDECR
jgi:hypothetical protein